MKRFKFTLQTLHDLREQRRDAAERSLAQAAREVEAREADLLRTTEERTRAAEDYIAALNDSPADAYEALLRSEHLRRLAAREEEARRRLADARAGREARRGELVRAARDAEILVNLREQHRRRYLAEHARAEQSALDEIAVLAAARRVAASDEVH